jgi:ribonuclease HI
MIHVWTDGCCKGNPGPGGAGVVIVLPDGPTGWIGRPLGATTNNRAELLAVRIALEALAAHSHESLTIHTDSQNVIGWVTGAFRVNANVDLVREIQDCVRAFASVSFVKVRGHSGDPNNEAADRLAQQAAAGVTVTQWGCPSGQVSAREHIAREVEALLARPRQLRDPSLARAEQLLDEAFTVFRAPTTETRSCAATAVAS